MEKVEGETEDAVQKPKGPNKKVERVPATAWGKPGPPGLEEKQGASSTAFKNESKYNLGRLKRRELRNGEKHRGELHNHREEKKKKKKKNL